VDDGGYDASHNARIAWDHSFRQISEWDGALWDKHHAAGNPNDEWLPPVTPGARYEYNDVRVNRLALSLLRIWKPPLPEALKEEVMHPIGTSDIWRWHGYRNSILLRRTATPYSQPAAPIKPNSHIAAAESPREGRFLLSGLPTTTDAQMFSIDKLTILMVYFRIRQTW